MEKGGFWHNVVAGRRAVGAPCSSWELCESFAGAQSPSAQHWHPLDFSNIWVKVSSSQIPSPQDFGCFSSWCLQPVMLFVSQQMDLFSRDHPGPCWFCLCCLCKEFLDCRRKISVAKRSLGCHGKAKNNDNNCKPCLTAEIAVLKEEVLHGRG